MPSQPSPPSTDATRLAHVFVRLPNPHPQTGKPSAPPPPAVTSSNDTSASAQHSLPSDPITPHKLATTFNPLQPHHLPPTPDLTPTQSLKRSHTAALLDPPTPSVKRRPRTNPTPSPSPSPHPRLLRAASSTAPKFSIAHRPQRAPAGEDEALSWMELKRVAESVMGQVDWGDVAKYVASNRAAGVYKRTVRDVLQERIEELVRREGTGE